MRQPYSPGPHVSSYLLDTTLAIFPFSRPQKQTRCWHPQTSAHGLVGAIERYCSRLFGPASALPKCSAFDVRTPRSMRELMFDV
jgi:hypothetical protein